MSKSRLLLLGIFIGLVAGFLLGYLYFPRSGMRPVESRTMTTDTPGTHQYYYLLNDTLAARHTVTGSDGIVHHRVDTVAIGR
jgi:hypothetical protein